MRGAWAVPCTVACLLVLIAAGCKKKFIGYTKISHNAASNLTFYVNLDSIQRQYTGDVSLSYVAEEGDGKYSLLEIFTNCKSYASRTDGTRYASDGTMLNSVAGDIAPVTFDKMGELLPVVSDACTRAATMGASFSGDFDIRKAMLILFGNYDPAYRRSRRDDAKVNGDAISPGVASVILNEQYKEGGATKRLVLTSTVPAGVDYSCHACSPQTSGFVFVNRGGKWTAETSQNDLGLNGGWGTSPKVRLARVGTDKVGVIASYGNMSSGLESGGDTLLVPISGKFVTVLDITTLDDNRGNCGSGIYAASTEQCYSGKATYDFQPGQTSELFDVKVHNSGTKLVDGKPVSNEGTVIYSYSKGKNKYLPKS